jgi:DNA invertase Pin-like site-specific DNA recombinase
MKKEKNGYQISKQELELILTTIQNYAQIQEYIKQKLLKRELLSTEEVAKKYCISRYTIYRLQKKNILIPVLKNRTFYFDSDETNIFFSKYWNKTFINNN